VPFEAEAIEVRGVEMPTRRDDYSASSPKKQSTTNDGGHERVRRHTEQQIRAILMQFEAGVSSAALCDQHGISRRTLYRWRGRLSTEGDGVTTLDLQQENRTLRGMIADLSLENQILKNMFRKK
jgi:putative transposase